jgi:phenylacetate-coenzyme A ligase PaaK-like adenylate-forming protein
LLDEIEAGGIYELVLTNFHGGVMTRYRIGDMVRITALRNEKLGIRLPQMTFERRVDDVLYFVVVKLTEKLIWQAIESLGFAYEDWIAYKIPGEDVMNLLIEPKGDTKVDEVKLARDIETQLLDSGKSGYKASGVNEDWRDMLDFSVEVILLPQGTFARYTAQRQSEGSDLAHLKPPHVNPPEKVISLLTAEIEETIIVTKSGAKVEEKSDTEKSSINS